MRFAVTLTVALIGAALPARAGGVRPTTEDEKVLYALGQQMGETAMLFYPSERELAILQQGIADKVKGVRPGFDLSGYGPKRSEMLGVQRHDARTAFEKSRGVPFLEKAAREKGAVRLPSGLVFKELRAGSGESPSGRDYVTLHLRGTLVDGREVDNTFASGKPLGFPLGDHVIPCWREALERMKPGGKARLVCPPTTAHGDRGRLPLIPGGATLVYELELLEVTKR